MKDKLNLCNSFRILYRYVCKRVARRILVTKFEIASLNQHFLCELNQSSVPLFYGFYFFSSFRLLYPMNVASEVLNVGTPPERNLPCRILCRHDGEYESVIVIRVFWTVPPSRTLCFQQQYARTRAHLSRAEYFILRRLFAAKYANGKSESLKSLFAGRTDVLE